MNLGELKASLCLGIIILMYKQYKLPLNIERQQGVERNATLTICSGHRKREPTGRQQSSEAGLEKAQLSHVTYLPGTSLRLEMHYLI